MRTPPRSSGCTCHRRRDAEGWRAILAALEAEGRAIGVTRLLLETGELQPEAIALYRSAGFSDTAPFGASYPLSVFLEKRLQGAT